MDTLLIIAIAFVAGYAFAIYHGKSKRALVYALPMMDEITQPTPAVQTQAIARSSRRNPLPALEGYVTHKEHSKALAHAETTHQKELASAVEAAREALYIEATQGLYNAYRLGAELAKHDVAFEHDQYGIRLTKVMGRNNVMECIVTVDGNVHYVRGNKADLARLLNNGATPQRTMQTQDTQPALAASYNDEPPPYSAAEIANMGR